MQPGSHVQKQLDSVGESIHRSGFSREAGAAVDGTGFAGVHG